MYGKQWVAIAAAMLAAGPALGQADYRVFEAMRAADSGRRAIEPVAVHAGDLVQMRSASESRSGDGAVREYSVAPPVKAQPSAQLRPIAIEGPARVDANPAQVDARAVGRAREADEKARAKGAVFYVRAPGEDGSQPRPYITETQRAAEHARYEASKRRGLITPVAAAGQARPRQSEAVAGVQAPGYVSGPSVPATAAVTIHWSGPERQGVASQPAFDARPTQAAYEPITPAEMAQARAVLSNLR